jgi:uncharacterized protein YndB with AHSA1/START domain
MITAADGTLETRGDTSVLRYERHLRHPIDRVWRAITEPDEIEAWLARADIELAQEGRVELEWLNTDENGKRYEGSVVTGTITALEPPNLVEYDTDVHGRLRWELQPAADGTDLTLKVTNAFPEGALTKTMAGWHVHLDFLEEALEGERVDWSDWPLDRWAAHHERYVAKLS